MDNKTKWAEIVNMLESFLDEQDKNSSATDINSLANILFVRLLENYIKPLMHENKRLTDFVDEINSCKVDMGNYFRIPTKKYERAEKKLISKENPFD